MRIGFAVLLAACAHNGATPGDSGAMPDAGVTPFQPTLGAHWTPDGSAVTFRVASTRATRIELELFDRPTGAPPIRSIVLDNAGGVFSTQVAAADLPATIYYGYRAWGPNWPFDPAWQPGNDVGWIADVDSAAHVSIEARVEETGWILEGRALGEGELHDALVGFSRAEDAIVGPDRRAHPLPLLDHVRVRFVDELAHSAEGFPAPVTQLGDSIRDELRGRWAFACGGLLHVPLLDVGAPPHRAA